jgi:hypothetical protein
MFNTLQDFFKKRGVPVMTVTDLFNFVIDQSISDEGVDDYLEKVLLSLRASLGAKKLEGIEGAKIPFLFKNK